MTVAENAAALEALRGLDGTTPGSVKYARTQHFVGTQGNSGSIRTHLATINAATSDPTILAATAAIDSLVTTRDSRDTLLRDRLLAVDVEWAPINADLAAHSCGGYGQGYGGPQ
jgi:hypothetical protein